MCQSLRLGDPGMTIEDTYYAICSIRRFEERLVELKQEGLVQGSLHLCCGQEAVPTGACRVLRAKDALTVTYRGHGWALARGVSPVDLFAEVMGRDSALCGGRGGSPYLSSAEHGLLGENSIVAAGLPIASGAALAARMTGEQVVSLVSIGEGALNQGAAHETLNLAGVMELPLVVVVENNGWSELTPADAMVTTPTYAERATIYGMPGTQVDGNDADDVESAVAEAVDRARNGVGPSVIEAITTRLTGHYDLDPQHYRSAEDLARAQEVEPLQRLRAQLAEDVVSELEQRVSAVLDEALDAAKQIPFPDPASAHEHIYG